MVRLWCDLDLDLDCGAACQSHEYIVERRSADPNIVHVNLSSIKLIKSGPHSGDPVRCGEIDKSTFSVDYLADPNLDSVANAASKDSVP